MSKSNKTPTPLSVMLGDGGSFDVKGKPYSIRPIALKDVEDFMKDNLSLGTQLFNVANKESKGKIDKWMKAYCFDGEGKPVDFQKAMDDGWDIVDLKEFIKKLCDFSG